MGIVETVSVLSAAAITLGLLSYLYRENLIYRIAEHAYIGGAAGYGTLIITDRAIGLLRPWIARGLWYWYLTVVIGLLYLFFFSSKYYYLYRYPTAIVLGVDIGVFVARAMKTNLLEQIRATVSIVDLRVLATPTELAFFNDVIVAIGVVCALFYFYATMEHRGPLRYVSKIGIYFLMAGFGASFGVTVMARISLFIGRLRFLYFTEPAYYVVPIAGIVLLIGIILDLRKKKPSAQ